MKIKSKNTNISIIMALFAFLSVIVPQFIIAFNSLSYLIFEIIAVSCFFVAITIVLFLKLDNDSIKTMIKRSTLSVVLYIVMKFLFIKTQFYPFFVNKIDSDALTQGAGSVTDAGTIEIALLAFSIVFSIFFIAINSLLKLFNITNIFKIQNTSNFKILKNNIITASITGLILFIPILIFSYCNNVIQILILTILFIIAGSTLMLLHCKTLKNTLIRTGVLYLFTIIQIFAISIMQITFLGL